MGELDVFVAPRPNFPLIGLMTHVNRTVMLKGVAGLRDLFPFNRVAGLRGITNIPNFDFPEADRTRLASVIGIGKATFLTPNHPEFFTDWMIDKELASQVAPKAAFWATHSVVNGLGRMAQKFWLANNLIAQIPGNSAPAREYSIDWALKGHGLLLHPEGMVGWHGDYIAPLMGGVVEMAREALRRGRQTDPALQVWIAPVVWKLTFDRDVEGELHKECAYVERRLNMAPASAGMPLPQRIYRLYEILLARDEQAIGIAVPADASFAERKRSLATALCSELAALLGVETAEPASLLRSARRRLREAGNAGSADTAKLRAATRMLELNLRLGKFAFAGETVSQEGLAEHLKRIRNDYLKSGLRDTLNLFVPQPAGPRTAHIRVLEPLAMHEFDQTDEQALALVRSRMQAALDKINADLRASGRVKTYANPFRS